jgi:hypothetical protein
VPCPKCGSDAHRSHSRGLTDYLTDLWGRRFWAPATATEREIRATRARVKRRIRLREFLLFCAALLLFSTFLYVVISVHGGGIGSN